MLEIKGRYNLARVFTDNIEAEAVRQIETLCNQESVKGSKIRIMPDVHSGAGCTIGTTMTISDKIVPNLVGVDIGCGMELIRIDNRHIDLQELDRLIHVRIPCGFNIRKHEHQFIDDIDLNDLYCKKRVNLNRARNSIGTLGGGNHFIEANRNSQGDMYIVVHSGSRHLGQEVATLYQADAFKALNKSSETELKAQVRDLKAGGKHREIQKRIKKAKEQHLNDIPKDLAYLSQRLFKEYMHDMKIVQRFADLNRKAMIEEIATGLKLNIAEQFTTVHNYIDTESMILRKGAVSARTGEQLLIPINMRDGSLICRGKGNPDWNYSAPHGAGRLMSRTRAKATCSMEEFRASMTGIYTTTVNRETLDECPQAYKPMEEIIANIGDTVDIKERIIPVYNFKAAE